MVRSGGVEGAQTSYEQQLEALSPLVETITVRWRSWVDEDFYQDLRQVARLAAWRAILTYDATRGTAQSTYLFSCVQHAVLDALKAYRRDRERVISLTEALPLLEGMSTGTDPADVGEPARWTGHALLQDLTDEPLRSAILQLDACSQEIIAWSYGAKESDAQIARRLRMKPDAIKKRRQRALGRIKSALSRCPSSDRADVPGAPGPSYHLGTERTRNPSR